MKTTKLWTVLEMIAEGKDVSNKMRSCRLLKEDGLVEYVDTTKGWVVTGYYKLTEKGQALIEEARA